MAGAARAPFRSDGSRIRRLSAKKQGRHSHADSSWSCRRARFRGGARDGRACAVRGDMPQDDMLPDGQGEPLPLKERPLKSVARSLQIRAITSSETAQHRRGMFEEAPPAVVKGVASAGAVRMAALARAKRGVLPTGNSRDQSNQSKSLVISRMTCPISRYSCTPASQSISVSTLIPCEAA